MQVDFSLMLLYDDVMGDVQSHAGSFPHFLGGKKWIENAGLYFLGDAWTGVFDLDYDPLAFMPRSQGDFANAVHRIDRIVDEIRPDLV